MNSIISILSLKSYFPLPSVGVGFLLLLLQIVTFFLKRAHRVVNEDITFFFAHVKYLYIYEAWRSFSILIIKYQ